VIRKRTHSTCNPRPIYNFLNYHRLFPFYSFISFVYYITNSKNKKKVFNHPRQRQTMIVEMQAFEHNGIWQLVLPFIRKKKAINCHGSIP